MEDGHDGADAPPADGDGPQADADAPQTDADAPQTDADAPQTDADTFGVGIHVTPAELRFVVHVPSDIDAGWTDPEAFQRRIEEVTWARLDRESVLRRISAATPDGETVTLGTVTLRPDGTVVDHSLRAPSPTDD